ncbi:hypothetical protein RFI_21614 [Reticulomyxa filosa]|uniref:Uncharacterized protein n=1 Tax=Reticulomyxa filosa TaxID=46433 RepID=X6MPG0_RETFI|nr:hypothetical protein RFI_21614 [Reticulomyxa filosa]|eukprot:ETO15749.1 hypothetical protein RFI_21614 [Reticulomyxa filosa]
MLQYCKKCFEERKNVCKKCGTKNYHDSSTGCYVETTYQEKHGCCDRNKGEQGCTRQCENCKKPVDSLGCITDRLFNCCNQKEMTTGCSQKYTCCGLDTRAQTQSCVRVCCHEKVGQSPGCIQRYGCCNDKTSSPGCVAVWSCCNKDANEKNDGFILFFKSFLEIKIKTDTFTFFFKSMSLLTLSLNIHLHIKCKLRRNERKETKEKEVSCEESLAYWGFFSSIYVQHICSYQKNTSSVGHCVVKLIDNNNKNINEITLLYIGGFLKHHKLVMKYLSVWDDKNENDSDIKVIM